MQKVTALLPRYPSGTVPPIRHEIYCLDNVYVACLSASLFVNVSVSVLCYVNCAVQWCIHLSSCKMGLENPDETDGAKTEKRCQTCKQPMKGHKGQAGKFCQNVSQPSEPPSDNVSSNQGPSQQTETVKDSNSAEQNAKDNERACSSTDSQVMGLLSRMVDQMASVNNNIQGVLNGQNKLIDLLGKSNGNVSVSSNSGPGGVPPPAESATLAANSAGTQNAAAVQIPVPEAAAVAPPAIVPPASMPLLSEKLQKSALLGEFVNLSDFLPHNDIYHVEQSDPDSDSGRKAQKHRKPIDNFDLWLTAWNNYEALLVAHKPEMYSRALTHRQLIQKCNNKYMWQAVYTYDMRFRAKLAATRSLEFNTIDTDLFVTILDSTAVKQNVQRCYRCKSYDHTVHECPFPPEYPVAKETKAPKAKWNQKSTSSIEKWFHNGQEICNNWQQGRCTFPSCKRAHVCKGCRGDEPFYKCSTCSKH